MSHMYVDASSVSYSAYTTPQGQLQYAMGMLSYQVETDCVRDACRSSVYPRTKNAGLAQPACSMSGRIVNCFELLQGQTMQPVFLHVACFLFAVLHNIALTNLCSPYIMACVQCLLSTTQ